MTFPNAYNGVKKIFTAEILSIIAAGCAIITAIFGLLAIAGVSVEDTGATVTGGVGAAVFGIGSLVLGIVSYIMNLIGLYQAGKDEGSFKTAFMLMICVLILAVVSGIISAINGGNGIGDNIVTAFSDVARILVFVLVIQGITVLADKLNNPSICEMGTKIMFVVIVVYGLSLLAKLIPAFFGRDPGLATVESGLNLVAGILSIISYIVYLVYLGKAKNMLKNN